MARKKIETKKEVKQKITKKTKREPVTKKKISRVSSHFVYILAIVSIIGFLGIIVDSILEINIDAYVSFLWLIVMGIGFI